MTNFMDHFEGPPDEGATPLRELRLGPEPAMVLVFTKDVEEVKLHYEQDESVRSYVPCPGDGCPLCYVGSAPQVFLLLPVYSVESGEVEVLRISTKRGPGTLGALLLPHLKDPEISEKVLMISRHVNRYRVEARDLSESADRGASAIEAFREAAKGGLELRGAFPELSAAELSEVERVRRKLEAIGGYSPPSESTNGEDAEKT